MVPIRRVVLILLVALAVLTASPAVARISTATHESQTETSINSWRTKNDRVTLKQSPCLNAYADQWARHIAAEGQLVHRSSASLRSILSACKKSSIGENLARGSDSLMGTGSQVTVAWMRSPGHKKNMLNPAFRWQAVGSYYANGQWWVVSLLAA